MAGCSQRQERDDKAVVLSFVDFCFVDQILRRVVLVIPDSTRPNVFLKCLLHWKSVANHLNKYNCFIPYLYIDIVPPVDSQKPFINPLNADVALI